MICKENKWDAGTAKDGTPRTKDNAGRNTTLNLRYYSLDWSKSFRECNVHERIARKCGYAIEGRMARFMNK